MLLDKPFLIEDIDNLRREILAIDDKSGKRAELWNLLKKSARNAPMDFGWFVPFTALMTQEDQDVENARNIIFTYLAKLDPMSFCSGLQYHFWCFAFPHAKVCMYFQWLCTINAFTKEERKEICGQLLAYHFTNFYYGMRSKPEPECVDNQTLSLCLSNTIVGYLFANGENSSEMAKIMLRDGTRRLPIVIGDMPVSGYSGEGSSYMDCVNGPAIPLAVELLERITGEKNLLFKQFTNGGGKPINVLEMVAREFMPGALLLPWDNYGYQFGVRSALAYAAEKTKDNLFYDTLEKRCIWTYDIGIGWAYDDLVWTLIWWPSGTPQNEDDGLNWFEPSTGGTLVSKDSSQYCIQMWDESEPIIPTRAHVNPNAVLFSAYDVPLSADGSPVPGKKHSFMFEDTWRSVGFLAINTESHYNYGDGCVGAHSCIILDNNDAMRAFKEYKQMAASGYSKDEKYVWCDTAPIYKENFPDVQKVVRKTSMHCDRFYTVEDLVKCDGAHDVTARFLLRPFTSLKNDIIELRTNEGVNLDLCNLLSGAKVSVKDIENHPFKPDAHSQAVDFTKHGNEIRNLFIAFMGNEICVDYELKEITAYGDETNELSYENAKIALDNSTISVDMSLPAYMLADLPNHKTWWYRTTITNVCENACIKMPKGMWHPQMYFNSNEVDLSAFAVSCELLPPIVAIPTEYWGESGIQIDIRVQVPVSHYDGGGDGTVGMTGGLWLCHKCEAEHVQSASYENGEIKLQTNFNSYTVPYTLL